jgi:hypothetical protein
VTKLQKFYAYSIRIPFYLTPILTEIFLANAKGGKITAEGNIMSVFLIYSNVSSNIESSTNRLVGIKLYNNGMKN